MEIIDLFKKIISDKESLIVFEFGMCDAYHSNILLNVLSENKKKFIYHGFEPVKELFDNIVLKYDIQHGVVHKFNKAISTKVGVLPFFKSGGYKLENGVVKDHYYGSSSIRKPKLVLDAWKEMTFEERTVEATTFDYHIEYFGLKDKIIDFIWADIQGAEIDLINGGKETFKNVRYFYTEYANSEYYEGEIDLKEICKMLPYFEIVEDFGGDVLLMNKLLK
jgi:FkbM family methyltransferase